jgi:hypothetical protein
LIDKEEKALFWGRGFQEGDGGGGGGGRILWRGGTKRGLGKKKRGSFVGCYPEP